MNVYFLFYLFAVNIISALIFISDKRKAQKKLRRIPEKTLHIFELLGGVFSILPLMYFIRHKNRKFSYYWFTWLMILLWTGGITYYILNENFVRF